MIDTRALAIIWLSTALLVAAGLAFGMHSVSAGTLADPMVDAETATPDRVMPADMPENALPDWLEIERPDRLSC